MEVSVDRSEETANKVTRPFGYGSMFNYPPTKLLQVGRGHRLRPHFFPESVPNLSVPRTEDKENFDGRRKTIEDLPEYSRR